MGNKCTDSIKIISIHDNLIASQNNIQNIFFIYVPHNYMKKYDKTRTEKQKTTISELK